MNTKRSVLIVDRSAESRQVLRTALERKGLQIFEAAGPDQGLAKLQRHQPGVVVVDLEHEPDDEIAIRGRFARQSRDAEAALVVLGTVRIRDEGAPGDAAVPRSRFVAKPYHYGPLVRLIESLLPDAAEPLPRAA